MQQKNWSDKVVIGSQQFKNRVVMAALTRIRGDPLKGIPTDMFVQYYSQRAGAGMILSQASSWSPRGIAFPGAGHIFNSQQVQGWKKVTKAVHQKNGKIYIQIFHGGRAAHSSLSFGNLQTVAPSAIAIQSMPNYFAKLPQQTPKQMTLDDIKICQQQFRKGIINSKQAGFDGVQIHGAHGYLVDQFIRSSSNKRTDQYGGSIQNRSRFCLQLVDIALQFFKPQQIGLKFSPVTPFNDMYQQNPLQIYSYLMKQLDKKNIGFVEIRQGCQLGLTDHRGNLVTQKPQIQNVCKVLRQYYKGIIIANDTMHHNKGQRGLQFIKNGWADMISFGRTYISNPDLAQRLIQGNQINQNFDYKTFYINNQPKGYIDYPFYNKQEEQN